MDLNLNLKYTCMYKSDTKYSQYSQSHVQLCNYHPRELSPIFYVQLTSQIHHCTYNSFIFIGHIGILGYILLSSSMT